MNNQLDIISSAIFNLQNFHDVVHTDEEVFTDKKASYIHQILKRMYFEEMKPDLVTIGMRLESKGVSKSKIDTIIAELGTCQPVYNFKGALFELEKQYYTYKVNELSAQIIECNNDDAKQKLIRKLNEYNDLLNNTHSEFIRLDESDIDIDETYKRVQYVHPGYDSLHGKIRGFFRGQLITVAARPGKGKTTLMLNIMRKVAQVTGRVVYMSMEMIFEELYSKMLSADAEVENWKIEVMKMTSEEKKNVNYANDILCKLPIDIYDKKLQFKSICSIIRKYNGSARLIIIDYLQLIKGASGENQNIRISNITGELKQLAINTRTPIIILSQLNREIEKTKRIPQLSDLRDSGSIEQDSDVVMFIHEDSEFSDTSIIVAKNRKGPIGQINGLRFKKEYSKFTEVTNGY